MAEGKYNAAKAKADDDINIRYADAAAAVAKAEYDINKKANDKVPGSVPQVRMNELLLKCQETELAIEKAKLDQKVAGRGRRPPRPKSTPAKVMVQRHKVLSPLAGVVVDIRTPQGRMRCSPRSSRADPRHQARHACGSKATCRRRQVRRAEFDGRPVTVDVDYPRPESALPGKVVFVEPHDRTRRQVPGPRRGRERQTARRRTGCSIRAMQNVDHVDPVEVIVRGHSSRQSALQFRTRACRSGGGPTSSRAATITWAAATGSSRTRWG